MKIQLKGDRGHHLQQCNTLRVNSDADVVVNHMCASGVVEGRRCSSCGSYFNASKKEFPSVPYSASYTNDDKCPPPAVEILRLIKTSSRSPPVVWLADFTNPTPPGAHTFPALTMRTCVRAGDRCLLMRYLCFWINMTTRGDAVQPGSPDRLDGSSQVPRRLHHTCPHMARW
ncbi:hypothetical protein DPEC_G00075290 [Dallia pectoralis]|uniref:Uncharacterized protein n=1 Tax=Dallia pectoralis TaxID=75939 RepID=A0ACC2H3K7_DALPE|nr:hypothetical protein DPEC_G00075290 [Dallia pectoralis]